MGCQSEGVAKSEGAGLVGEPRHTRHSNREQKQKRSQTESIKEFNLRSAEISCFIREVTASLLSG